MVMCVGVSGEWFVTEKLIGRVVELVADSDEAFNLYAVVWLLLLEVVCYVG